MEATLIGARGLSAPLLVVLDSTYDAVRVQILPQVLMEIRALTWAAATKQRNATVERNALSQERIRRKNAAVDRNALNQEIIRQKNAAMEKNVPDWEITTRQQNSAMEQTVQVLFIWDETISCRAFN